MSGVWIFKSNGVMELHENRSKHQRRKPSTTVRRKILEHLPTRQVVSSYASLERILRDLGWVRYYGRDPRLFQFHKPSSVDLISLPISFAKFSTIHMYDIVVKNPNTFHVRNM